MSVAKRPDGKYRGRFRDQSGKEYVRHFVRKGDAVQWVAVSKAATARGDWVDPTLAKSTVAQMAAIWLKTKAGLKPTTRVNYESCWRVHVLPTWGRVQLRRVTPSGVAAWVGELTDTGISASTARMALLSLKQILDLAVQDGCLAKNPASAVKAPRLPRAKPRFLTHDQLLALATACGRAGPRHEVFVLLAGQTGLRWGELRALRVKHLDLDACRLSVEDNLPDRHRPDQIVTPKGHQSRTAPFPKHLRELLAPIVAGKGRNDFVFSSASGQPMDLSNWRRSVFDPAVATLDLDDKFTPHDLRHTAASLAIHAGADVKVVQRMLGHASAAMTLDIYAGVFPDSLDAVADLMDAEALRARQRRDDALRDAAAQGQRDSDSPRTAD